MSARVPAIVLGGTGYVAGELVRLLLAHPQLELVAVASDSQPGEPVARAFPHLAPALGGLRFASHEEVLALRSPPLPRWRCWRPRRTASRRS
jgi:N-acetyl-gamma-glutamylphosphate reductase